MKAGILLQCVMHPHLRKRTANFTRVQLVQFAAMLERWALQCRKAAALKAGGSGCAVVATSAWALADKELEDQVGDMNAAELRQLAEKLARWVSQSLTVAAALESVRPGPELRPEQRFEQN